MPLVTGIVVSPYKWEMSVLKWMTGLHQKASRNHLCLTIPSLWAPVDTKIHGVCIETDGLVQTSPEHPGRPISCHAYENWVTLLCGLVCTRRSSGGESAWVVFYHRGASVTWHLSLEASTYCMHGNRHSTPNQIHQHQTRHKKTQRQLKICCFPFRKLLYVIYLTLKMLFSM